MIFLITPGILNDSRFECEKKVYMPRVFQHFVKDIFAIIINTMIELKSVYHKIILEEGHDRNPRTKCEPTTNSVERKR